MDQLQTNQYGLPSHFLIHPELQYFLMPVQTYLRENFPQCTELILQVAAFNGSDRVLMERDPVSGTWCLPAERYDGRWSSMLHFAVYIVRVRSGFVVENVDRLLSIALDWIDEETQSLRVVLTFAVNVYFGDNITLNPCNMWASEEDVEDLQELPEVRIHPEFLRGLLLKTYRWRNENLMRFRLPYPKVPTFPERSQVTHGGTTIG
ncbi:hypothetical protein F4813DRAFT_393472 [Daldinia decipiens]|uniref:uncharacterized protein n=1 Tax=Daldinia decipiens TaxID=326647 RepID=UPI0020C4E184|nr:uncharacterized protein F4813DRAFT_393472 [Daldinia decipiens]KAI1653708.1 hypothetical protein F4813DRAFT_393472 [Daldinia decipiens]